MDVDFLSVEIAELEMEMARKRRDLQLVARLENAVAGLVGALNRAARDVKTSRSPSRPGVLRTQRPDPGSAAWRREQARLEREWKNQRARSGWKSFEFK